MTRRNDRRRGSRAQGWAALWLFALAGLLALAASDLAGSDALAGQSPLNKKKDLIAKGRTIFFNETFKGNGRTCGTCHRAEDNFTITPAFIATLPRNDPLFVAETNRDLAENFENPRLMREFGLILENLDGFNDLANKFVMRGVPHVLALRNSVNSPQGPRTGWSGDGAPGDGTLRAFATGAVIQHFTKTLNRVADVDFRLPTDDELDAVEAFMLSLGRQQDLQLPLPLKGTVAKRGQEIFRDNTLGKCNICHFNAGANADPGVFGPNPGNRNFNTGVESLPDQPARLTGERVPLDDGLGRPGDGTFNTPPLVEAADTGPFFHNNSIETIEGAVAFYTGAAFRNSPSGQVTGGINLDGTQVVAVAAFLRVINALENIRQAVELLEQDRGQSDGAAREMLRLAAKETGDAIKVLDGGGLHARAVDFLRQAKRLVEQAAQSRFQRRRLARLAIEKQRMARAQLIE
jgi:cytochrome c peroxidase